jgi:predicted metalloprotease with PDZ domain
MRALFSEFALKRGFTTADVERTSSQVCRCELRRFFDEYVRGAGPLDFNVYLAPIGYRVVIDTIPAADSAGTRLPDTRIWATRPSAGGRMRVMIQDPSSVWAKAGLHTGVELAMFNGVQIDSFPDFRRAIRPVKLGDSVPVDIFQGARRTHLDVRVTGYDRARARIVDIASVTPAQLERRSGWLAASVSPLSPQQQRLDKFPSESRAVVVDSRLRETP